MKLYVYDHCPYCVRVLMAIGAANLPIEVEVLLNDDEATPMGMVGKKMVPILERADGQYMGESLDIIEYLQEQFGNVVDPQPLLPELNDWIESSRGAFRPLIMPYIAQHPFPEFATDSALAYFTRKKEASIGPFEDCLANTAASLNALQPYLDQLECFVGSWVKNDRLSWDDIHLFPILRNLTLVPGVKLGLEVSKYLELLAIKGRCPLYH